MSLDTTLYTEYGQIPTPPPGSQLTKIEIRNDDHNSFVERQKERYIWFPLHDVDFAGKLIHQPLSFIKLVRGRIHWLQSIAYKQVDNSQEIFDQMGDEEAPLRTFTCTPYAQFLYLHSNYADKGFVDFPHLAGKSPGLVATIEQIILPVVGEDLITLASYLSEQSPKNITEANLDFETLQLAQKTLTDMMNGVGAAIKYCRELIKESEGEIMTRQNKGWGKAHLDDRDRYAYQMIRKPIPAESTLDNSPEQKTNQLLEKLVGAVAKGNTVGVTASEDPGKVAALESQLAELQRQFELLLQAKLQKEETVDEVIDAAVERDKSIKTLQQKLDKNKR